MAKKSVDVFWSMNSPYCYCALDRILALHQRGDVDVVLRLVLPGILRNAAKFAAATKVEERYFEIDAPRTAAFLGLPFGMPRPWPTELMPGTTFRAGPDQSRCMRLYHLTAAADEAGEGWAFLDQVMRLVFDGSTENWHHDDRMGPAIARAGLDMAALDARAAEAGADYDALFEANDVLLRETGHWGPPTFGYRGEPFY